METKKELFDEYFKLEKKLAELKRDKTNANRGILDASREKYDIQRKIQKLAEESI